MRTGVLKKKDSDELRTGKSLPLATIGNRVGRFLHVENQLLRELMAEFLATALFLRVGTGSVVQWVVSRETRNTFLSVQLAWGFAVTFSVYLCAGVTGGHINPAITIMQWSLGNISFMRMVLYSIVQTLGAYVGSGITYVTYLDALYSYDGGHRSVIGPNATANCFATYPSEFVSIVGSVFDQIVGTGILGCCVASFMDKRNRIPEYLHPLLAGFVVMMIGMSFGLNDGYPINPARDLGARLWTLTVGYGWETFSYRNYTWFWVPILGPSIGGIVGAWTYKLFVGLHGPERTADFAPKYLLDNRSTIPMNGIHSNGEEMEHKNTPETNN